MGINAEYAGPPKACPKPEINEPQQKVPDLDDVEPHQHRQRERDSHLHALREDQHVAALETVGQHAAQQGKEEDRNGLQDGVEGQQPRGVADLPDQPALREHLHPGADGGRTSAATHQAESRY